MVQQEHREHLQRGLTSFSGTDVCGTATVQINSAGLSDLCGATGRETVTFTLTDACGNDITASATFTIEDTTDPVWSNAPANQTVECDGTTGASGAFAAWLDKFLRNRCMRNSNGDQ